MTVDQMSTFFALLAFGALALSAVGLVLYGASPYNRGANDLRIRITESVGRSGLALAWLVATVATLGSLYYSEVAHYTPCRYCWYQRIAMYPLVVILGIAALKKDLWIRRYVFPLVAIGGAISTYHYVLQRFPDLSSSSCDPTAPCTSTYVWKFGFLSIPMMALGGFLLIAVILMYTPRKGSDEQPS